ncbi:hypothetical protein B0H14DRAFT_3505752 [Mycena olivaceomarginata]|nr:hypothetical protein B0H14DRAFT_3505752 [Mycena olivaceomarginata]
MPPSTITRKIVNSTFPAIGFGAMGISSYYGAVESDEECFKARVLDAAHAAGDTFWDPADIYSASEECWNCRCRESQVTCQPARAT